MPNYCDYTIKIVGTNKNCEEFVKKLKSYDEPNHFWRIFDADIYQKEKVGGKKIALYISGYCAWSLETCCRASGYSDGIDLFEVNTRKLNLKLEAYSRETGLEFEEHYIYDHGECLVDDCEDIYVHWWNKADYPTYKDYLEENPSAPPENLFNEEEGNDVIVGGFGEEFGVWHI